LYDSDSVALVLDTFNKKLDNYAFIVNPAGAQRDAENYDDDRQIGLSAAGDPVPIMGGVRLTGRQGKTSLGIVDM
jgi:hypothetical protein